jgi:hypothetical protein
VGDAYFAHADPGFGDVDEETVLCPFAGALGFFGSEVGAVLLEVDLHDEGYTRGLLARIQALHILLGAWRDARIQTALVFAQQRQCVLCLPRLLEYHAA